MLSVVWLPEADADLQEARAWYDRINPDLGERFALAVEATVEAIALHPLQFPVVHRGRRPRRRAAFPLWNILRRSRTPDRGNRLLARSPQSETLAVALTPIPIL